MEKNIKSEETHKIKKQYLIKKDNDFNDILKVKESFEDPNKYLKKDKQFIIGKINLKNNNPLEENTKKISLSYNENINNNKNKEVVIKNNFNSKSKSLIQEKFKTPIKKKSSKIPLSHSRPKTSIVPNKHSYYNINSNFHNNNSQILSELKGIHYQRKTLNEVLNILKESKYREKKNKSKGTNDLFPKEVREDIKRNYYEQEKILEKKLKDKCKSDYFSKILSNKVKRKEEEMLYNKIEEYRLKKQLIDYIENEKPLRDKFGDNYWIVDLRRTKKQDIIRFNYVNNGNKYNTPEQIIDYADKDVEFIHDPNRLKENKYVNILRNLSLNSLYKSNKSLKLSNMEKMNEIGILRGKNIIEEEYNRIIGDNNKLNDNNRKFKLYKDPMEKKFKNVKEFCNENYVKKIRGKKIKTYILKKNKEKRNLDKYKKDGLYRSQSKIEENKNDKRNKISYLKEAIEIFKRENKKSSIRIISSN